MRSIVLDCSLFTKPLDCQGLPVIFLLIVGPGGSIDSTDSINSIDWLLTGHWLAGYWDFESDSSYK